MTVTAEYLPGDRWLVVTGTALAYLDGSATDALRLWKVLADGGRVRDALDVLVRGAVAGPEGGLARLGAFVLAESTADGMLVLCRDIAGVAVLPSDGDPVSVSGSGLLGWSQEVLPRGGELVIGSADSGEPLPVPGGVVRAGALRWRPAGVTGRPERREPGVAGTAVEPAADWMPEEPAADAAPEAPAAYGVPEDASPEAPAAYEVPEESPADVVPEDSAEEPAPAEPAVPQGMSSPPVPSGMSSPPVPPSPLLTLPPLPSLAPLPPLPPFVPAPEVLPPIPVEAGGRAIEETRYDLPADPTAGVAVPDAAVPDAAVPTLTAVTAVPGVVPAGHLPVDPVGMDPVLTDALPMDAMPIDAMPMDPVLSDPVPIDAVPPAPPGGADPSGDHDGMTQLAEDLPIGYTPPPAAMDLPVGTVLAALCPSGHANAPHSITCRLCGRPIEQLEPVPVQRPVLARIRLSTGEVVDLDRPVVLGRAPYASRVAASELPRLVTVPSPNHDISRAHVQIRAADWQLVLADLDSTNGTTVQPPGRAPLRLHPGQEIVVEPGWSVDLGDGVGFVVEALA